MKINYLSASFVPSNNANSVHVIKMCAAFARRGHDITLFAHPGTTQNEENIFTYYGTGCRFNLKRYRRIKLKLLWNFHYAWKLCTQTQKDPPDLIFGRHLYSLAAAAKFLKHITVSYEAHSLPTNPVQKHLESWLFRQPNFKKLVVITKALAQDYLQAFPALKPEQIMVAPDGADPLIIQDTPQLPTLPGRENALKACYAGRLIEGKGAGVLTALARQCPDIDFHIFGGKEEEIAHWKNKAGCPNIYFHGHIPHARLVELYPLMDVMLPPCSLSCL